MVEAVFLPPALPRYAACFFLFWFNLYHQILYVRCDFYLESMYSQIHITYTYFVICFDLKSLDSICWIFHQWHEHIFVYYILLLLLCVLVLLAIVRTTILIVCWFIRRIFDSISPVRFFLLLLLLRQTGTRTERYSDSVLPKTMPIK